MEFTQYSPGQFDTVSRLNSQSLQQRSMLQRDTWFSIGNQPALCGIAGKL